jgi:molybdopterin-containing oxidoreductase family iron-sulfur binding subunit
MDDKRSSRRTFLATTGAAALGVGVGVPILAALARENAGAKSGEEAGPRWAMVVDRSRCPADCRDCIDACHAEHNVPDIGTEKEEVKWVWKEEFRHAFPNLEHEYLPEGLEEKPTLVFCNHCDNPPCVRVCPTQSTWKREDGVVMMDMHRCIGCRYCIVGCPYGSRSFNWRDPRPYIENVRPEYPTRTRGVVEKCNFCAERLAKGQIPRCVEACREAGHDALCFGDIRDPDSEVRKLLRKHESVRRKSSLGTLPHVFYIVGGDHV